MLINKFFIIFFLLFWPFLTQAEVILSDFKFFKNIPENQKNYALLKIDADLYQNASNFFADLRVIKNEETEIPYQIVKKEDWVEQKTKIIKWKILKQENNIVILDREDNKDYFGELEILSDSTGFVREVKIYGSSKLNNRWQILNLEELKIYNSPAGKKLKINFKFNNFRYIKIEFLGSSGEFLANSFFSEKITNLKKNGLSEEQELDFEIIEQEKQKIKILVEAPFVNFPLDFLKIKTTEKDFDAQMQIYASNQKKVDNLNSWAKQYDGEFSKRIYYDEPSFEIRDNKKYYLIIIESNFAPPKKGEKQKKISIEKIIAKNFPKFLYFNKDEGQGSYKLFYGNNIISKKKYNLLPVNNLLDLQISEFGEQKNNPFYKKKESIKINYDKILFLILTIFLFLIFIWFIYKIIKENINKDKDDNKFVDKL